MWKKDSPETPIAPPESIRPDPVPPDPIKNPRAQSVIGSEIIIQGEVSGTQDLLINGRVEGRLSLTGQSIRVGKKGRVKADLLAKVIEIEGTVDGTLQGEDKIILNKSGRVRGKLIAPCVGLEESCIFNGTVVMDNGSRSMDE